MAGAARGKECALHIRPATAADLPAIEAILDAAFGPARRARTAALLRRGGTPIDDLSLVAEVDTDVLASIQFWPIALVADAVTPLTLLGPLAVAPPARDLGFGRALLRASLARADVMEAGPIMLIGDLSYYGPFGFTAAATGGWVLPGPAERERLLLRHCTDKPLPSVGRVVAAADLSPVDSWSTPPHPITR